MKTLLPKKQRSDLPDPLPNIDKTWSTIATYVIDVDIDTEWKEIREWIRRKPTSRVIALEMLAEHADISVRARRLSLQSKREFEKFEREYKDRAGILRGLAIEHWESQKKQGMTKQITKDMIEDFMLDRYGDFWRELNLRLRDMKNVMRLLEHLSDRVTERAPHLRTAIDKLSESSDVTPAWMDKQKVKLAVNKHKRK